MSLSVWTRSVSLKQLGEMLSEDVWKNIFQCAMLEWWNAPAVVVEFLDAVQEICRHPDDLISGSVFGQTAEIRWRKVEQDYWLVLISEQEILEGDLSAWQVYEPEMLSWDQKTTKDRVYHLWGSQYQEKDNHWVELRIPRPLDYPVEPIKEGDLDLVQLKIKEYYALDGTLAIARRYGLQAKIASERKEKENAS